MGGKNDEPKAGKTAAKIAEKLYKQTNPMRKGIIGRGEEFMAGGFDPTQMPMWDIGKAGIESQYGTARQNILSNMPAGGGLNEAMMQTDLSRANQLSGLGANIAQDEYNKLYGLATGTPQQSMSTLANVGASQANLQAQQSAGKMGALGDVGTGAGLMMGMKLCDRRLKKNISHIGVYKNIPIYEFEYLWSDKKHIGPMAQDLLKIKPEAVFRMSNGFYAVKLWEL